MKLRESGTPCTSMLEVDHQTEPILPLKTSNKTDVNSASEKVAHCELCGWNFDNHEFLQLHKVLMHSPHRRSATLTSDPMKLSDKNKAKENFRCKECDHLVIKTYDEYVFHLRNVHDDHRHVCNVCAKMFKLRGSLLVHQRVVHNPVQDRESFVCKICGRKFTNKYRKDTHEKKHADIGNEVKADSNPCAAGTTVVVEPFGAEEKAEEKSFQCNLCDKKFKLESHLNQHWQTHEAKQWDCDICKKTFTTKYFLKKHRRLHTGETPYSCSTCGKSFTFQQSYHKHMLYHTDEKPYSCSQCGRAFKELSTLQNHERIHSGERPFACETCGKSFRQRVSYLVHRRIHTGVMPYSCDLCNKTFRYKVTQRTHKCAAKKREVETEQQTPLAPETEGGAIRRIPELPQQIQDDLQKFRRAQSRRMLHNRLNNYLSKSSTHQEVLDPRGEDPHNLLNGSVRSDVEITNELDHLQQLSINENMLPLPPISINQSFFQGGNFTQ